jgi:hypothetical protein
MDDPTPPQADDQYSLAKTVGIWFLGGAPMWILGWLVYPAISKGMAVADAGLMRLLLMTIGLAWQFVLAMIILYCEEGNIRWATIFRRFWLRHPISPKTGRVDKRLWWWLIPLGVLVVAVDFVIAGPIDDPWVTAMPFLAEPEGYHASALGWLLLLIVAMFAQFVVTSRLAGPIYGPVGKYYGVLLFGAAALTVLLRSAGAREGCWRSSLRSPRRR